MADFCVYWFRRAHDELKECTTGDQVAGRAGLVGTQNVRNNDSRVGGLDYIAASGTIIEAVDNQPWSGEANVHVSIANWIKTQQKILLPKARRLWFKAKPLLGAKKRPRGSGSAAKQYELDMRQVPFINSALSGEVDVSGAAEIAANAQVVVQQGITPGHAAFVLTDSKRDEWVAANPKNSGVIHPYMIGDDILGDGRASRWLLDFQERSVIEAQVFKEPFLHVQSIVLPHRMEEAEKGKDSSGKMRPHHKAFLAKWWLLSYSRPELSSALRSLPRYLACSRVTKRPLFAFVCSAVRPGDALQAFALSDDYSFGVLQSNAHYEWFHAKCSNMKSDPRYTSESVFHTFPWPQAPSDAQVDAVAAAGRNLRNVRTEAAEKHGTGLRVLYRTLDLPGKNPLKDAHDALDAAVHKAYGFSNKKDLLQQVLELNLEVASKIGAGKAVVGPGVPSSYKKPASLVTKDCFGK